MCIFLSQFLVLFVLFQLSSSATWLGVPQILSLRLFLTNYLVMLMIIPTVWSACYYLWVHVLVLQYPMPFIGLSGYLPAMMITFLIIICKFPKSWQVTEAFKKRWKFYIFVIFYTQIIFFTYFFLEAAFTMIDPAYQWVLAISLPLIREFHIHVFGWLCHKSAGIEVFMYYIHIHLTIFLGYFK
jgi:hypothetical protein